MPVYLVTSIFHYLSEGNLYVIGNHMFISCIEYQRLFVGYYSLFQTDVGFEFISNSQDLSLNSNAPGVVCIFKYHYLLYFIP